MEEENKYKNQVNISGSCIYQTKYIINLTVTIARIAAAIKPAPEPFASWRENSVIT
jgi:hypothetical protein